MQDDADIRVPRAPFDRYDYGLFVVCGAGIAALVLTFVALLFG